MEVQGDRHQHHHAHESKQQKGGQQGEMAKMRNARGRNDLGLREGLKQIGRLFGASCGIPGPKSGTWGTHIFWRDRNILFRLVRRVFEIVHGSTDFFLRGAGFFGAVFLAVVHLLPSGSLVLARWGLESSSSFPTLSAEKSGKDG